jgi:hypothetical protein
MLCWCLTDLSAIHSQSPQRTKHLGSLPPYGSCAVNLRGRELNVVFFGSHDRHLSPHMRKVMEQLKDKLSDRFGVERVKIDNRSCHSNCSSRNGLGVRLQQETGALSRHRDRMHLKCMDRAGKMAGSASLSEIDLLTSPSARYRLTLGLCRNNHRNRRQGRG